VSAIKCLPFLSVKETSAIAGKDMNMNAYKKHSWLSLRFKLRAILIETLLALTQRLKSTYATGVVMTVQEDGTIKENMSNQTEELL
jgi:hypothetical protein